MEPAATAAAPVSSGAGLTDITVRTIQGGVVEAVYLELQGPLIIGGPAELVEPEVNGTGQMGLAYELVDEADKPESCRHVGPILEPVCGARRAPLEAGRRYVAWNVAVGNNERVFPIAILDSLDEGDRIEARNLANGEAGESVAGPQGTFRINLASDVGDPILITVRDGESGATKWSETTPALTRGYGFKRGSKEFRRILGLAQTIIDPADPGNYAPHIFMDPLPGMTPKNVLSMSTVGDLNVPVNSGVAYARALGVLDYLTPNPARGGKTDNEALIDAHVVEAIEDISPFTAVVDGKTTRVLFDPADFDEGTDELGEPKIPGFADLTPPQPPMRPRALSKRVGDPDSAAAGVSGMSLPYLGVEGEHGFLFSSPFKPFNMDLFCIN
ncbi:MAG: hypothetical protein K8I02_02685, partial [Candidatus Methylomirabilis sp.]|nr:hypothetical protein [Deltaproteobacteria bacterium]